MAEGLSNQFFQWFDLRWRLRLGEVWGYQRALFLHAFQLVTQLRLADPDHIARLQFLPLDRFAVDQSTSGTTTIDQQHCSAVDLGLTMNPRDVRIGELRVAGLTASDNERLPVGYRKHLPLIRAASHYELPVHKTPPKEYLFEITFVS